MNIQKALPRQVLCMSPAGTADSLKTMPAEKHCPLDQKLKNVVFSVVPAVQSPGAHRQDSCCRVHLGAEQGAQVLVEVLVMSWCHRFLSAHWQSPGGA